MPLVDPGVFEGQILSRVYLAGRLREAKGVEATLSARGIDYVVEVEKFQKYLLGVIPRQYDGAAFYVLVEHAQHCREVLSDAGFRLGVVEDDPDE